MRLTYFLSVIILSVMGLAACRKSLSAASAPGNSGRITYLNVSEDMKAQISRVTAYVQYSHVLIDNADTSYVYDASQDSVPYFYQYSPLQYPLPDQNITYIEPWVKYSLLSQGNHQLILTDTGHHPVAQVSANLTRDIPLSAWFMDSLGFYRGMVTKDIYSTRKDSAGLRVLDASPDAGTVFFTINKEYADTKGFPDSLQYGSVTGFIQHHVSSQDTLRLRFYSVHDSTNVLAKSSLVTQPGHAYTFVLAGYNHQRSYMNPHTGRWMSISQDIQVLLFKNN